MLDIISDTPLWVWAVLALLIERGIAAMAPATLTLRKLVLLPGVFTAWSLYAMHRQFGTDLAAYTGLTGATTIVALIFWYRFRQNSNLLFDMEMLTLSRPGTPAVLLLSLTGFTIRYTLSVITARDSLITHASVFPMLYGLLSGLGTGALWGMALGQLDAGLSNRPRRVSFFGRPQFTNRRGL